MGFADLWIAEIAADRRNTVEKGFSLYNHLLIADKHQKTHLALAAAKAIISHILAEKYPISTSGLLGETEAT
ncbi:MULTISPECIES: hypothetical protein [unclassified Tolypothrix]|uniref:hypothetical protein n=1 Tax=unclassified Tolypothrix TaxID=2649714 RepID=UPI0005EAAFBB|nr:MULTISPECIES: hypothetical protein [unclassified Tolypothrix]BAY28600.1 hypothetical protein NIES2107_04310 [Nostoc carneum NIES-2107]BAY93160.1 hypothetical protein NIES3275_51980 [Microchaete diplosiphon NIES-3275]EKF00424.1 hypothetical protein FDUTEX481_09086 [Tolypothrix sp. PCC 7601]MBE9084827.1 hypothetical protein [Tolypothrix sp. LEGE 11397]UYD27035.1 hypothetical protein HGR01_02700 [Tolypothrix sp. PCC 7712]